MCEGTYKTTPLFAPDEDAIFNSSSGVANKTNDNINADNLFIPKNIYRHVKEEISPGPIKTKYIEKITKIPRVIFKERKKDINKKEKKVVTKEIEIEEIVEVIENKDEIVYNEVKVPTYIDIPIIQPRQEIYHQQITKNIPKGVELTVTQKLVAPKIKPKYVEVPVPIYVPCYIEVPIPIQYIPIHQNEQKQHFTTGVSNNTNLTKYPTVCSNPSTGHMQGLMGSSTENKNVYVSHAQDDNKSDEQGDNISGEQTTNVNLTDEQSIIFSSKSSIQNISNDEKNRNNMIAAANL
ncbi:conserved Plasmodium protein, unknown function [Plasmodium malariae]|uniref:Uncharacterized protein n=1 Tax=Plasmodium malariae TaxID=5858 RepID=A0A1C3KEW3_PLAMA|nr:conserved Plasmodium protein, unknown function [Plasmodium malariae]